MIIVTSFLFADQYILTREILQGVENEKQVQNNYAFAKV